MKIESYHICSPIKGLCKQYSLMVQEGNRAAHLVYFQRPKFIDDDAKWEQIVKSIKIDLPKGFEI